MDQWTQDLVLREVERLPEDNPLRDLVLKLPDEERREFLQRAAEGWNAENLDSRKETK